MQIKNETIELARTEYTTNSGHDVLVTLKLMSYDFKSYALSIFKITDEFDHICFYKYDFHSLKASKSSTETNVEIENEIISSEEVDNLFKLLITHVVNNESKRMKEMYNKNILSRIYSKALGEINKLNDDTINEYTQYIINSNSKDRIQKIVKKRKAGSDEKNKQRN